MDSDPFSCQHIMLLVGHSNAPREGMPAESALPLFSVGRVFARLWVFPGEGVYPPWRSAHHRGGGRAPGIDVFCPPLRSGVIPLCLPGPPPLPRFGGGGMVRGVTRLVCEGFQTLGGKIFFPTDFFLDGKVGSGGEDILGIVDMFLIPPHFEPNVNPPL